MLVRLEGDWRISRHMPHFDTTVDEEAHAEDIRTVRFDTTDLGEWDSSLVAFALQGRRYCEVHDIEFDNSELPPNAVKLIELASASAEADVADEADERGWIANLGQYGIAGFGAAKTFAAFVGSVALAMVRVSTGREPFRWADFWLTIQSNSAGALPIVTLISFLVGLIIAFLGAVTLEQFAAGYYVSYLISFGMLREMGALMTAIIIAGRTGAAFAAELGSMKIMEEIDAFETLGLSPISYVVLPRVLGLTLMMPLLTIYATFIGIIGGMIVSVSMLDITTAQFFTGLLYPVELSDGLLGVFKGFVFGIIIGISGCMQGISAGSDAGAVGKAATSAVVLGITLIITANAAIDWVAAVLDL